jgi:NTP pyrophosphatase (non-canonical NTP hydrolase)
MTGNETQESIGAWADENFPARNGRLAGIRAQCLKLLGEAYELASAAGCTPAEMHAESFLKGGGPPRGWHERRPTPDTTAKELADVAIVAANVAHRLGVDLGAEVDAVMKRNRARTWDVNPDGSAQHVGGDAA